MKKIAITGLSLSLLGGAVFFSRPSDAAVAADEPLRAATLKLYQSLSEEQKKLAVLDFGEKERFKEVFPASKRLGVPYSMLNAEQKALIVAVV